MSEVDRQTDQALLGELGDWLGRERLRRNVTQAELAHEAGVSKRTVERLERGESVQLASLLRVLRALGLTQQLRVLLPEATPSPIERLRGKSSSRKRASPARSESPETTAWQWDEEP